MKPQRRITRMDVEDATLTELVRVYRLAHIITLARAVGVLAWAVLGLIGVVTFALYLMARVHVTWGQS